MNEECPSLLSTRPVQMAGWSVCPFLTLSRAEDKEHDGADDVDQRRQVEHILPL